ncbi:tyrosine-protein phosphatase [Paractinoplanes deccanensis]|nr:tyrosine-protein phosphatase [Actinoplanes deccanensis]
MQQSRRRFLTTVGAGALAVGGGLATSAAPAQASAAPARAGGHRIPFTAAKVSQNADGSFTIGWTAPGVRRVAVYAGKDQHRISRRRAVAHGGGAGTVTVRGLGAADRWWFEIVPERGQSLTLADRSLHLAAAPNFRDGGGYRTAGGQWVRMGVFYRSNSLATLTDADVAKLKRLGIRTDIDFRTDAEVAAGPDRIPAGTKYVFANVAGTSDTGLGGYSLETEAGGVALMVAGEKSMVSADSARKAYHTFLTTVADPRAAGVLYHCTAGKDRTGWASAALLTALGVPRATVFEDYLLSNSCLAASNAAALAAVPASIRAGYKAVLDVRAEYLQSGFDEVAAKFGTFDGYLREGLGISARSLRARLLVG